MLNYKLHAEITIEIETIKHHIGYYEEMEYIQNNLKKFIKELRSQYGKGKYKLVVEIIATKEQIIVYEK